MANIPTYIKENTGKKNHLPRPAAGKILDKTYGVVTYQEDVLLIAIELAGYNWDTVDKFRKAIGKNSRRNGQAGKDIHRGLPKHGGLTMQKRRSFGSCLTLSRATPSTKLTPLLRQSGLPDGFYESQLSG